MLCFILGENIVEDWQVQLVKFGDVFFVELVGKCMIFIMLIVDMCEKVIDFEGVLVLWDCIVSFVEE